MNSAKLANSHRIILVLFWTLFVKSCWAGCVFVCRHICVVYLQNIRCFLLDKTTAVTVNPSFIFFLHLLNRDQRTDIGLISLYCLESEATAESTLLVCQCRKINRQHNMRGLGNEWSRWLFGGLESERGKTGQFPVVVWSPARPQHTPSTESEESNPSVEVHRRKRRRGRNTGPNHNNVCVCGHC